MMRRRMMMQGNGSAPPEIRFVSFLVGDGKAYIDTGYYCDFEHRYVMEVKGDANGFGEYPSLFGTSDTTSRLLGQLSINFGVIASFEREYRASGNFYRSKLFELSKQGVSIDGTQVVWFDSIENRAFDETLLIFQSRYQNALDKAGIITLKKFEVWNGKGQQVLDMRPAVDSKNIPGLYDMVSGKMFYNAAADGKFTWEE